MRLHLVKLNMRHQRVIADITSVYLVPSRNILQAHFSSLSLCAKQHFPMTHKNIVLLRPPSNIRKIQE